MKNIIKLRGGCICMILPYYRLPGLFYCWLLIYKLLFLTWKLQKQNSHSKYCHEILYGLQISFYYNNKIIIATQKDLNQYLTKPKDNLD